MPIESSVRTSHSLVSLIYIVTLFLRSFFPKILYKIKTHTLMASQFHRSLLSLSSLLLLASIAMADSTPIPADSADSSAAPAVHIIYTEKPLDEEPEAYHLRTLASVLGSEDAAKQSLLYSYKSAASGFSAKLTPEQVSEISKQPGVLQVVPSRTLQLHSGPYKLH